MKILWLSWKDIKNPAAGGAEVVQHELAKRLVQQGHSVKIVSGGFKDSQPTETIEGYEITRVGGRYLVYPAAAVYIKKHLYNWPDIIIEEINTFPFFSQLYLPKVRRILLMHMLAREIWFYQIFFPLNIIGYCIEPVYLRILNKNRVITVSQSSANDLLRMGFQKNNIHIIPEGLEIEPLADIKSIKKAKKITLLSFGTIRAMKRTIHQLEAFEKAKSKIPELQLIVAGHGEGKYFKKFLEKVHNSPYQKDIVYLGKVSKQKKQELMQKAHLILMTSVKEGWGLIISEANSQATPAIAYNIDGLRDSVKHTKTGIITKKNTSDHMAKEIVAILKSKKKYQQMKKHAWEDSLSLTFDNSFQSFQQYINKVSLQNK